MFQFHKVRLKARPIAAPAEAPMFQFHKVRLKVWQFNRHTFR